MREVKAKQVSIEDLVELSWQVLQEMLEKSREEMRIGEYLKLLGVMHKYIDLTYKLITHKQQGQSQLVDIANLLSRIPKKLRRLFRRVGRR